jgi:multidrug transporter EmrE-like cation transporter
MLALAVSILASTLFSLTIKVAHRRDCTLLAVGATNYLTAAVIYVAASVVTFVTLGHRFPAPRTLLLGAGTGILFVTAFVFIAELQPRKGISITTAALRLSVLFPVVASLAFWGERARGVQIAGMLLALASLPLLGYTRAARSAPVGASVSVIRPRADIAGFLITVGLFVANGLVNVALRLYHQVGAPEEKVYYFAALFVTAAVASRVVVAATRQPVSRKDLLPGVFLGIWNTGASFLLLVALATIPGFIAFPMQSALALVLTAAAAMAIWRERVSPAGVAGIALAVAAAVLLNL